ncbi:tripartite tricarboxylate transporter TctB family protein [Alkalicoccus luteus]|uniref:Tripartite tricarboxylate transporter TctB family protein n=1 Tax=Alkalicoccus luteus TaxID=1237094 RepID=A0A969TS64_9BACI|nr:tripartite tricarboxylate transporter TctB family protein [Alkalicoccus luteus]NJP36248.1 tripartite tricarboxylate transporter TctB family protein [Alkalicoccus luteus]
MGEIIVLLLLIIFSGLIFMQGDEFAHLNESQLGPGTFPQLIAVLLAVLSLVLLIRKIIDMKRAAGTGASAGEQFRAFIHEYKLVIIMFAMLTVYIVLIDVIGFVVMTLLFVIAAGLLIGPKKRKNIVILVCVSVVLTFSTYLFFQNVLYVRFPSGILL